MTLPLQMPEGVSEEVQISRLEFIKGQGSFLFDQDNKSYLDFCSGILTHSVGHCHPEIVKALQDQAEVFWGAHDFPHPQTKQFLTQMSQFLQTPSHGQMESPSSQHGFQSCAFFSTGAEAVEAALRVVWAISPPSRNRVGALRYGFHGKTMGARMLVHWDIGTQCFSGNSILAYSPYCYRCPLQQKYPQCDLLCAKLAVKQIAQKKQVAALVFEPILAAAGVIVPPDEYWPMIAKACRDNGVLLVADEISTGGGRTGRAWGCDHWDIKPDLLVSGKSMSSGFPFSFLLARENALSRPETAEPGFLSSAFAGNALALAVAQKTLAIIMRDNLVVRSEKLGRHLRENLKDLQRNQHFHFIGDIRGKGLLIGIEIVKSGGEPDPLQAQNIFKSALKQGLKLGLGGNILRLSPPCNIADNDILFALKALESAFSENIS